MTDQDVISKFFQNSPKMIALSFGVIACRCKGSGRDFCCLICLFMYLRYYFTVWQVASTSPARRTQQCINLSLEFPFSTSFGASCHSRSSAIWNRAFFRCSNCYLIVPRCCRCRNRLVRRPRCENDRGGQFLSTDSQDTIMSAINVSFVRVKINP